MIVIPKQLHTSQFVQDMTDLGLDSQEFSEQSAQWLMWRSKPSPWQTWLRRWKRIKWLQLLSGRTLKSSHSKSFVTRWTFSLPVTPANPLALMESAKAKKMEELCGGTLQMEFGFADHPLCSLKTSKDTSPSDLEKSLAIWKSLVTKRRGEYSRRLKLAHPTEEKESSYWPTPTTAEAMKISNNPNFGQLGLSNHPKIHGFEVDREKLNKDRKGDTKAKCSQQPQKESPESGKCRGQLSVEFVEQLMGVTVGLDRLLMLGNGVVPAQAEKAFRTLASELWGQ